MMLREQIYQALVDSFLGQLLPAVVLAIVADYADFLPPNIDELNEAKRNHMIASVTAYEQRMSYLRELIRREEIGPLLRHCLGQSRILEELVELYFPLIEKICNAELMPGVNASNITLIVEKGVINRYYDEKLCTWTRQRINFSALPSSSPEKEKMAMAEVSRMTGGRRMSEVAEGVKENECPPVAWKFLFTQVTAVTGYKFHSISYSYKNRKFIVLVKMLNC